MKYKIGDKVRIILENYDILGTIQNVYYYSTVNDAENIYSVKLTKSDVPDLYVDKLYSVSGFNIYPLHRCIFV